MAAAEGEVLRPVPALAALVEPVSDDGHQVHLTCPLPGTDPSLTVVRPLPGGLVHLQDTGEDGVHVLTLLEAGEARDLLREVLDPRGAVGAGGVVAGDVLALLERPDGAVRLRVPPGELELTVVTAGGACWSVDTAAARVGGLAAEHVRRLDAPALEELLDRLLAPG